MAAYMGYEAVCLLAQGVQGRVIGIRGDNYTDYDIEEALRMEKGLDQQNEQVLQALSGI